MSNKGLKWLEKSSVSVTGYSTEYLAAIPRSIARRDLNMPTCFGDDEWQGYEVSFLKPSGCPAVAQLTFHLDMHTPNVVESKSLKLYLNGLNNQVFDGYDDAAKLISADLSAIIGRSITVMLSPVSNDLPIEPLDLRTWSSLDALDPVCDPAWLVPMQERLSHTNGPIVHEKLYTRLFRANCLVTNQPDWATILIEYRGKPWDHEGLLQYLISYRNYQAFHEKCIDKVYTDLMQVLAPEALVVQGNFTRRGGVDISPLRASSPVYQRLAGRDWRQ